MSYIEDRSAFLKNPYYSKPIYGDFSSFYIIIAICCVFLLFLFILNIVFCCSKYSEYWQDRHTGNRWLVSIWSATPHKQPSLDYTELEKGLSPVVYQRPEVKTSQEYLELQKRESDI